MDKRKNMRLIALGLLFVTGTSLISRFVIPINDFLDGCFKGIGIGLILWAVCRMKHSPSCYGLIFSQFEPLKSNSLNE
jgi:hypothetical protein